MRMLLTGLRILAFCAMTTVLFAAPGSAQVELRPNLVALPASQLSIVATSTGGRAIRFSTTSWNNGAGPLELVAGDVVSNGQNVSQRVYYSDGTFEDYWAGTFVYHPDHNHFHFNGYARYDLEPINAPGGSPKSGSKTTFCIMDTTKVNTSLPGAPQTAVYAFCGTEIQGMSVGWGDTYGYNLGGQSIDITGNPSGDYCLTIQIDPNAALLETTDSDNIASSLVRIDVENSTVTVLDRTSCTPVGGTVDVAGISPATGSVGSKVQVEITGSGFAPGMSVSFENGSGPPPQASNVVVSPEGTSITALVTIKKGKPGKDPVWDLRVGSDVLASAFRVTP
jgi:hypothetical protein